VEVRVIALYNVSKKYHQDVLKNINLQISQGEQCVILGKSGSGKSTLLYLIGGMERCNSGEIVCFKRTLNQMDDTGLAAYRKAFVGFIFQFHFLLPTMSAWDNIVLPLKLSNKPIDRDKIFQYAKDVGIDKLIHKHPYELSGGEQQRVSLLRAIMLEPPLILCDEPTGNLDSHHSAKVIELLQYFAKKLQSTLLIVTHDQDIAVRFNRKIRIEDGSLFS